MKRLIVLLAFLYACNGQEATPEITWSSNPVQDADMLSEAADMSQLVTTDGENNIWWGVNNFEHVDSLGCDYGTGRTFTWHDASYKATLDSIGVTAAAAVAGDVVITAGGTGSIEGGGTGSLQP